MFARRLLVIAIMFITLAQLSAPAMADDGRRWRGHAAPFDYEFDNGIDTHQESQEIGNGQLQGFLYVRLTGTTHEGYPIAEKANCVDTPTECVVGWTIHGIWIDSATSLGGNRWYIDPALWPKKPGYTHFHREHGKNLHSDGQTEYGGYLLRRTAEFTFYYLTPNDPSHGRLIWQGVDPQTNISPTMDGGPGHGGGGGCGGCGGH